MVQCTGRGNNARTEGLCVATDFVLQPADDFGGHVSWNSTVPVFQTFQNREEMKQKGIR